MTPDTVAAFAGAATVVIAAVAAAIVAIIKAVHETNATVTATAKVNVSQDAKLDQITFLVDGRFSALLAELAQVKTAMASMTGSYFDAAAAARARAESAAHAERAFSAPPAPMPSVPFDATTEDVQAVIERKVP